MKRRPHQPKSKSVEDQPRKGPTDKPPPTASVLPSVKEMREMIQRVDPYSRLYFFLGVFAFACVGTWGAYKMEEMLPKPQPRVATDAEGKEVRLRSHIDERLLKEIDEELKNQ
ncbi:hypothetical protein HK101_009032 [Irineochytrium annulatum]|nr:hypothetical protein HK101_009032 [Irineochytrium annulatum]